MKQIYLVDDDDAIRDALSWMLRCQGLAVRCWDSAEAFLADYRLEMRGCLVLDIRMQAMSGTELFDRLRAQGYRLPTIFLTGHGDVPLAVQALKDGAFDFIEKPCDDTQLLERIRQALEREGERQRQEESRLSLEECLASLTGREREVMEGILAGKLNKVIAAELNIAMRTVEVHRARVFEKLGVRSAVELAQVLARGTG